MRQLPKAAMILDYEEEYVRLTTNFRDLIDKTFKDYSDRFDIIESQPIKV